jgi:alkanesulfonate monooxygenase SsuD/methylene tetrahydromethanopterin reductase-like flavin-dependent oxidoreductase (luciferase family)
MTLSAEIGLLIPAETAWGKALDWAGRAASAGISRLWGAGDLGGLALLAALARRLDIRVGAVVAPGSAPPAVLAKHLTGLDVVAGGRLDVAVERGPEARDVLPVLAALAGGHAYQSEGPVPVEGARCLPPAVQRPAFPLWTARPVPEAPPGAPGAPDGWWDAGLAAVEVTPWRS